MKMHIIKRTLKDLGVPPSMSGYGYLVDTVSEVIDDHTKLRGINYGLYVDLAKRNGVTPKAVERAIRHAIEVSYTTAPLNVVNNIFGNVVSPDKDKPTNKQYIATLADYVRDALRYEEDNI